VRETLRYFAPAADRAPDCRQNQPLPFRTAEFRSRGTVEIVVDRPVFPSAEIVFECIDGRLPRSADALPVACNLPTPRAIRFQASLISS
jgi:hypothetical protein